MEYIKEFDLQKGDIIRITMPAQEPFPAGWAVGIVLSAVFYTYEGWYIEFNKTGVSPGWQEGYGYWKQDVDGGEVAKLSSANVEPKYPDYIMEKVRQHLGLEPYDTSRDEEINNVSRDLVFQHVLEWEGIIGYDYQIRSWIENIYGVNVSTFGVFGV